MTGGDEGWSEKSRIVVKVVKLERFNVSVFELMMKKCKCICFMFVQNLCEYMLNCHLASSCSGRLASTEHGALLFVWQTNGYPSKHVIC